MVSVLVEDLSEIKTFLIFEVFFFLEGGSQSCEICGPEHRFSTIDAFKQHMQQHNQPSCGICSQFFKTNFSLKKHFERHHGSSAETQMGKLIFYFIYEYHSTESERPHY